MNLEITTTGRIVVLVTFVAYIIAVTLIGVFANRAAKKQAAEGYTGGFFAGGRGLGGLALGMMMMATLLSSGTFVSSHGMIYKIGLSYATICLVAHFSLILSLGGTGKKIGIIGRRTGVVSFIGLLKNRYNGSKALVVVLALPMVIFLVCYSASQVVGGARVFEVMTGGSYWVGLLLFGEVIGVYTLLGGMKSVAATSIFQGFVMIAAVVALVFGYSSYIGQHYGSLTNVVSSLAESEQTQYMLAPTGALTAPVLISLIVMFAISSVALPHVAQGNLAYKNTKSLKTAVVVGSISSVIVYLALLLVGVIVRVIAPDMTVSDYVTPYLSFLTMPSPLVGVMLSAVASAIQSTVASMLLVICAVICKDLYKDVIRPDASEAQIKKITPAVLILTCVVVLAISFNPPDAVQVLVNFAVGGLASALLFPLLLGLYWKRGNEYGALAGVISGFVYYILASSVCKGLAFGLNAFIPAVILSGLLMVVVSLATPKPPLGVVQVWFGKTYDHDFAHRN